MEITDNGLGTCIIGRFQELFNRVIAFFCKHGLQSCVFNVCRIQLPRFRIIINDEDTVNISTL
ncbi:MAG TPA: hypothetical protein DDY14_05770 [Chromatiaceae bacterium]|nr:hypothetical protein [Chromatiaceae bacterium]